MTAQMNKFAMELVWHMIMVSVNSEICCPTKWKNVGKS